MTIATVDQSGRSSPIPLTL